MSSSPQRRTVDWTQLHAELLSKIAGTLGEIADRLRFASVCKSWRAASKASPVLPWLLLPDDPLRDFEFRSLFLLSDDDVVSLHLPFIRKRLLHCSSHGWLLVADRRPLANTEALLLNPLTRSTIPLPPLPFERNLTVKFSRSKLLITSQTQSVVMISVDTGAIYCCRNQNAITKGFDGCEWTQICKVQSSDFTFYKDRYYVLTEVCSETLILDGDSNGVSETVPSVGTDRQFRLEDRFDPHRRRYLALSSTGEKLFMVITPSRTKNERFEVFELRETGKERNWVKVRSIGHDTLFVDVNHAIAVNTSCFNRWRDNCIVFLDYKGQRAGGVKVTRLGLYDIGNDRSKRLRCCWHDNLHGRDSQGWFVPSL